MPSPTIAPTHKPSIRVTAPAQDTTIARVVIAIRFNSTEPATAAAGLIAPCIDSRVTPRSSIHRLRNSNGEYQSAPTTAANAVAAMIASQLNSTDSMSRLLGPRPPHHDRNAREP